ncbi:hypothetical protein C0W40_20640 [Photobacterium leiognathi subsp. mandapamensis]|nr:hypothetical protein C0W40_20640 [Photobacterium leiognathi subsp. mandapamensis]
MAFEYSKGDWAGTPGIRPGWRSNSKHAMALNTAKPAVITKIQIQKSLVSNDEAFEYDRVK